jgi:sugar-specific transcriptional regulator TrmB
VFARLAGVQAEAEQIRTRGHAEAQSRRDTAAEQSRAILSEARRAVEAERAAAAATGQAAARNLARAIVTEAQAESTVVAERARQRQAGFVELVVQRARAELTDLLADAS